MWSWLWGGPVRRIIMTVLISMVPVVELRGAIPIAVANGVDLRVAILVSILGNLLPVPFIIIFIKKIFAWLRRISPKLDHLVSKLENRAEKKAETVRKYEFWGLFLLVAIPLPGTGAWTGSMVAAILDMPTKKAFPAIALGVLGAAAIVAFITYGVGALF